MFCVRYMKKNTFLNMKYKRQPTVPWPYVGNLTQSNQHLQVWSKFFSYIRGGPQRYLIWGAEKETLFKGLGEIYLFATVNLFLQFLQYRRRNNWLKTAVSMLSYVFLREVTIHISVYIIDCGILCFWESERDLRYVGLIGKTILKKGPRQWKRVTMSWKCNLCI